MSKQLAYVIDVDMGYGHARAAHALKDLALGSVISANNYPGIPKLDRDLWQASRSIYEAVSRLKPIPIIGDLIFSLMDQFQQIPEFYPRRDLSKPSIQLKQIYRLIEKGQGKHLIQQLAERPLPLVTTFFTVAFMADYYGYPGEIYLITTDTDIARHWVALDPKRSRIRYFAANGRCVERLQLYGVPKEHIYLTGFPLPKELIGGLPEQILQNDLMSRLCNLDPRGIFMERYAHVIKTRLGQKMLTCAKKPTHPLTVTFSVGGAGAQKALGVVMMQALKSHLLAGTIRFALFGGVRRDVITYFEQQARKAGLSKAMGTSLLFPAFSTRQGYFQGFTDFLHQTDMLITKPSELSFYTALGIPVVAAPPIGSQEQSNLIWLQYTGGGVPMADPRYCNEWLFDWLYSGGLARMAWNGFMEAPTHGTYRIEEIIAGKPPVIHPLPMIV